MFLRGSETILGRSYPLRHSKEALPEKFATHEAPLTPQSSDDDISSEESDGSDDSDC